MRVKTYGETGIEKTRENICEAKCSLVGSRSRTLLDPPAIKRVVKVNTLIFSQLN